jgi:PAS domain S-box-containing protein
LHQNTWLAAATQALDLERLRYRDLFERAPNGYVVTDHRGVIREINRIASEMLRPPPASPKNKPIVVYVASGDRRELRARLQQLRAGHREDWELRLQPMVNRPPLTIAVSVSSVVGEGGKPLLRWILQDITERKRMEEESRQRRAELAHALRVSTIGEIAAGLAHELNQPLAAITNYAKGCALRLRSGRGDAVELSDAMDQIATHATRAAEIVRHLRGFISKDEALQRKGDVNEIVREVARLVQPEVSRRGIALELTLAPLLHPIEGDLIQIEQVVLNLAMNAVESVSSVSEGERRITIETSSYDNGRVEVAVHDTGTGLPSSSPDRIYEAFFSTKPAGLGLGLSISRSIVEAHGGRLWTAPNGQRGATFRFTLPIAENGGNHAN